MHTITPLSTTRSTRRRTTMKLSNELALAELRARVEAADRRKENEKARWYHWASVGVALAAAAAVFIFTDEVRAILHALF